MNFFEELNGIESFQGKLEFTEKHLEFIGSGSSRCVFALNQNEVIKISINETGILRNNVEAHFSDKNWERIARTIDFDYDFFWVISERAQTISEEMFSDIFDMSINELLAVLHNHRLLGTIDKNYRENFMYNGMEGFCEILLKNGDKPIVKEIIGKSVELNFSITDIARIDNWGIRKTETGIFPIIVDYGNFIDKFTKFHGTT